MLHRDFNINVLTTPVTDIQENNSETKSKSTIWSHQLTEYLFMLLN